VKVPRFKLEDKPVDKHEINDAFGKKNWQDLLLELWKIKLASKNSEALMQ